MKTFKASVFVVLLIISLGFPKPNSAVADEWFNSYGAISWQEEQVFLGDFAVFLQRNPETNGYIAFYVGENKNPEKVKQHIKRVEFFLTSKLKIKKNRIFIVDAGKREETLTILQPVQKNASPPKFY